MIDIAALAGAAVILAGGLLITIPVPWGGEVPLGFTLAIALPALLPVGRVAAVDVVALALALLAQRHQLDRWEMLHFGGRIALAMAAGGGAGLAVHLSLDHEAHVLASAVAAAAAVLVAEIGSTLAGVRNAAKRIVSAVPVHLTLACAGVLFAVAVDQVGVAMAAVAALPLVVTRFAFRRYAEATETLEQTVQALGLVPELAGLAPLGHSERAASYAAAIAEDLGFDRPGIDRIVTATRLHHLGAVRSDESDAPTTPAEVAVAGARIRRPRRRGRSARRGPGRRPRR